MAILAAPAVVAAAVLWVHDTATRPSYDAFGWMVWGREIVDHATLNTDGAPSWKPLTFLFTLPYALFGRFQLTLWTVTATAAAFSAAVFAARVAYRLATDPGGGGHPGAHRRGDASFARLRVRAPATAAGVLGGLLAGGLVLGMGGFSHQVFIATSDPMVVALTLAAIDAHLSRRPRLALLALALAGLGRPEAWPFLGLYALWIWRAVPRARALAAVGVLAMPAGWFIVPGLTSRSWFVSGDLALRSPAALHHHQLAGVLDRFLGIYGLPLQLAVVAALALAIVRRDRIILSLAGAAAVWVGIEVAFAYHGWPAQTRYMMEAGAVLVTIVGATVGRVLSEGTRALHREQTATVRTPGSWVAVRPTASGVAVRLAASAAVIAVVVPAAAGRVHLVEGQIARARHDAMLIDRLGTAIDRVGGGHAILRCGHPVTTVGYQSTLAWYLSQNVGDVGYKPGREIRSGRPLVLLRPHARGWTVRAIHIPPRRLAECRGMRLSLDAGLPLPPPPTRPATPAASPLRARRRLPPASPLHARRRLSPASSLRARRRLPPASPLHARRRRRTVSRARCRRRPSSCRQRARLSRGRARR